MNLTKFSRDRMMLSATRWTVPRDFFEPLHNYLVYGFEPGSFWSAVLANDFMRAVQHSHPSNDICLLYTSPSPRDRQKSRMPSSA